MFKKLILLMLILTSSIMAIPENQIFQGESKVNINIKNNIINFDVGFSTLDFNINLVNSANELASKESIEINISGTDKRTLELRLPRETTLKNNTNEDSTVVFIPQLRGDIISFRENNNLFLYSLKKQNNLRLYLDGKLRGLSNVKPGSYSGMLKIELLSF